MITLHEAGKIKEIELEDELPPAMQEILHFKQHLFTQKRQNEFFR